jgi:hypothetical protein
MSAVRNPATASEGVWRPNSLDPRLAFGGLYLDLPDDAALPGGGVFGEPADVDAAVGARRVDVGLRGVDDGPAEAVEEFEHRVCAVVGGEPMAVFHGRADGSGQVGGGGGHGWTIPSLTCGFSSTRTLTCGVPDHVVVSRGATSAVGELAGVSSWPVTREWIGARSCRTWVAATGRVGRRGSRGGEPTLGWCRAGAQGPWCGEDVDGGRHRDGR